tara:strand:- start:611 stop:745 length:135 start_codon:yes stop_codon:yes gene_type:complete
MPKKKKKTTYQQMMEEAMRPKETALEPRPVPAVGGGVPEKVLRI